VTSFPFTPGHEVVGEVTEIGREVLSVQIGDRITLEPALGCAVRGIISPCSPCNSGNYANCERITQGTIGMGLQTGFCHDTGGGWGSELIAHEKQLHQVPSQIPTSAAVLTEPLSCAIHSVLHPKIQKGNTILIIGCGSLGLLTILSLKALAPTCTIIAMAKHVHQANLATEYGADYIVTSGKSSYSELSELTNAELYPLILEQPAVIGGSDLTFDCVGTQSSIRDAFRWTRSRGTVILVGMPKPSTLDLAPFWAQELTLIGTYAYGIETAPVALGKRSFEIALELLGETDIQNKLETLVRNKFPLIKYREAIRSAMATGKSGSIKTVFDFRPNST
jgi:threonine dehydrogenase-like Zn-dependent dehydrogenase